MLKIGVGPLYQRHSLSHGSKILKRDSGTVYYSICFLLIIVCVLLYIIQDSRHAMTVCLFYKVFSKAGHRQPPVLYSRMVGTMRNSLAFLRKIFEDYFKIGQAVFFCIFPVYMHPVSEFL